MSLPDDHDNGKKSHVKRQSIDSPLTVMSPSVRPRSTKMFRLSKTPSGPNSANINQVDPNIDATLLEPYSVEKETMAEQSIESDCDDVSNITAVTSSSVNAALVKNFIFYILDSQSPGMSDEMKLAIKTYLKSTSLHCTKKSLESKAEQLSVIGTVVEVKKNEDTEKLNNTASSTCGSQERAAENNSEDFSKINLSVPGSEFSVQTNDDNSCCGVLYEGTEKSNAVEASLAEVQYSPVMKVENAIVVPSTTSKHSAAQFGDRATFLDTQKDLTLSARKNRVFATRNLKLDNLSSPRELASYVEERAQNYSFLINEAYCETSIFCENCYSMRIELGLFSDKFAALAATVGSPAVEGNPAFVAELENLLRGKQAEIATLSSKLRDLTQENDQLSKQKEVSEKDLESYKVFFENEMQKKLEEIRALRSKLYEAEDLIDELKQAKLKQSSDDSTSQAEGYTVEDRTKIMDELDTARFLHQKDQQRINELEISLQRVRKEKNYLPLELQEVLIELDEKGDRMISDESKQVSIISLLEAKVAELGNKIDEALRVRKNEPMEQKSYLFQSLESLVEKIKTDVKSNLFADKWETNDVEISVTYFEKAVNIICQDIPQFEILIEAVALHEKLMKNEFKQLKSTVKEMVEEKKKWEMLFTNEKSRLDSVQEMILHQFCENKNYFSNLLKDFQSKWADTVCSATEPARSKSEENRNYTIFEMQRHIADLQEKLNEKWLVGSSELQKCSSILKEQQSIATSFQAEVQEMKNEIGILHESMGKDFKNSSTLLDSLQNREDRHEKLMDSIKKQLEQYEKGRDVFKEICERGEAVVQDLRITVENFHKVEEDIRTQNLALCKNLDLGRENFAPVIYMTENLTREKDKLENENATLRNTISKLTNKNADLMEMEKMLTQQHEKVEELQHKLNLLQRENERLGKACDDADEEVGDLKQQIFELLHVNAKLQAEMHGENEEAINRRMGYIEPPQIRPTVYSSAHEIAPEMDSSSVKAANLADSQKTKPGMRAENVLEERNEIQKIAEKESILSEAEKALTDRTSADESRKSKEITDQSCRTS
ncbi:unnamed protein product [Litomosoides sigmodontis]|uniref:Uncharacterized protein n=1 Tax=Litomosoides sigmodontis TaxID=42156 RepID=A0A3P6UWQ8_LITSI|nr:unnamed protein product [Litomosoides sigmodontis]